MLATAAAVPTFFTFIRNTSPGNNAGIPGLSLPVGLTKAGLPVGMELDGPAGSDPRPGHRHGDRDDTPELPAPKI